MGQKFPQPENATTSMLTDRVETAEYIYTLSGDLFALASAHKFHTLTYLFSMVRLEAAIIREDEENSVKR